MEQYARILKLINEATLKKIQDKSVSMNSPSFINITVS